MLGIDQAPSIAEARRVILATIAGIKSVLPEPPPAVLFTGVGDLANILHVLYWTGPLTRFSELTTRSLVTERLYEVLLAAAISFPYPIQTLHLADGDQHDRRTGRTEVSPSASAQR